VPLTAGRSAGQCSSPRAPYQPIAEALISTAGLRRSR
jgi:hypothetical protein